MEALLGADTKNKVSVPVITENLLQAGYEEITRTSKDGIVRMVKIPEVISSLKVDIPEGLVHNPSDKDGLVRLPLDAIPLSIIDWSDDPENTADMGVIGKVSTKMEELMKRNPYLVGILSSMGLNLSDIIVVSLEDSTVSVLV